MNHMVSSAIVIAEFMYLRMAVVTAGDTVGGAGCLNLSVFQTAELQPGLFHAGLQKSATAAAAVVVGPVGVHLDKVFFTHNGLDYKAKIFGNRVAKGFADNLTGILYGKLYF